MNLPNSHFQDFPIEFKEINPEDFPNFNTSEKINLILTDEGYIGDSFIENINLEEKNTVVLNCGVGSGKTTAIIKAIKQFYANEEYVIFVASPFVSLVEQYFLDIQEKAEIPENQIFRNEWIGETNISYTDKRVHVVTVNTLLGNPGEDSTINSVSKRTYLKNMVRFCEENSKKTIFIYDEIHDSIYNFKEKFIFNLWKWRNVIHKNFVISATYNEASKIVIEYLAELTQNKIEILEAERNRIPINLSDLYLHFDNANSYSNENGNLINIIDNIFQKDMDLDILCFSKKLCKDIISNKEDGAGKLLFEKYGENINDCTSGLKENERQNRDFQQNRYNKNKCNIGTNFKSGVSIEKNNHSFILIFPPVYAKGDFKSSYGIFSGGINSIIQALARKRKKGEIHILLPRPTKFNFDSFPFNIVQKSGFKEYFESLQFQSLRPSSNGIVDGKTIDYISLNQQDRILSNFYYNELLDNVQESVSHIESIVEERIDKVRLQFPEYKLFKLEQGENYIANKFKFLGKDLSGYVCYGAATNQFVNCNWFFSNWKSIQNFKEGKLQYCFKKFFENYFEEDWYNSLRLNVTDRYIYNEIRNKIFNHYNIKFYLEDGSYKFIEPFENKLFETQLIAFIQRMFFRNNRAFVDQFEKSNGWVEDTIYSRGEYFRSCIAHARNMNSNDGNSELVEAYLSLDYFRSKVESIMMEGIKNDERIMYLLNQPMPSFVNMEENDKFDRMYSVISEKDILINQGVFDFKRAFSRTEDINKKIKSLYNYIVEDFFIVEPDHIYTDGNQIRVRKVNSLLTIPESNKVINLISDADTNFPESYWESDFKNTEFDEFINNNIL